MTNTEYEAMKKMNCPEITVEDYYRFFLIPSNIIEVRSTSGRSLTLNYSEYRKELRKSGKKNYLGSFIILSVEAKIQTRSDGTSAFPVVVLWVTNPPTYESDDNSSEEKTRIYDNDGEKWLRSM